MQNQTWLASWMQKMNNSAQYMIISTCFFFKPFIIVRFEDKCLAWKPTHKSKSYGRGPQFYAGSVSLKCRELFMPLHFYLILQDLSALGHKIRYFFTVRQKRKFRIFVPWKPSLAISLVVLADKDGLELKILLYCNACNLLLMILRWSEFNKMKVGLGQVLLSQLRINGDIK